MVKRFKSTFRSYRDRKRFKRKNQPEQLAGNDEYTELVARIETRQEELDSRTEQLNERDLDAFFAEF